VSISLSLLAFRTWSCNPFVRAASCTSRMTRSAVALFGFISRAINPARGTSSDSSSSRLAVSSSAIKLTPVRLPPGRARLATSPSLTGSAPKDDRDRRGRAFRG
jgi:hypothetical protein